MGREKRRHTIDSSCAPDRSRLEAAAEGMNWKRGFFGFGWPYSRLWLADTLLIELIKGERRQA
jgi:hypothetical protein